MLFCYIDGDLLSLLFPPCFWLISKFRITPRCVLAIRSQSSGTSRVSRRQIFKIRALAFERRILSKPNWAYFVIWGAGRDGHSFFSELSPRVQSKVIAFLDVDPEKCGKAYINHHHKNPVAVPVFHHDKVATLFEKEKCIVDSAYGSVPIVACVAKRQKGSRQLGRLEYNLSLMNLIEGQSLWYTC